MGYNTKFNGKLTFTKELTASQLAKLSAMLGKDCRDHPEWARVDDEELYYVDLSLVPDFSGLEWDNAEKTYNLDKIVSMIVLEMRKVCSYFGLSGVLDAQGDDFADRWTLYIGDDGLAHIRKRAITGKVITCPHCEERFELEEL